MQDILGGLALQRERTKYPLLSAQLWLLLLRWLLLRWLLLLQHPLVAGSEKVVLEVLFDHGDFANTTLHFLVSKCVNEDKRCETKVRGGVILTEMHRNVVRGVGRAVNGRWSMGGF